MAEWKEGWAGQHSEITSRNANPPQGRPPIRAQLGRESVSSVRLALTDSTYTPSTGEITLSIGKSPSDQLRFSNFTPVFGPMLDRTKVGRRSGVETGASPKGTKSRLFCIHQTRNLVSVR
jgi:hypothetical protein